VTQDSALHSLIPYLDRTEHPFALQITFPARKRLFDDNGTDPFIILNDTDPLTRLFMGKLITGSGAVLKDLFLLVQRDEYQLPLQLSDPRNNTDIEYSWQEAVRLFADSQGGALSFIPRPTTEEAILPFRSLFYCALKDVFFHPLCPACGGLLELCTDDELLETAGLLPYSSSLQRYLHCPSCVDAGNVPRFFVIRKEESDPAALSDLHDLIRGFGQVLGNTGGSFPCSSCTENGACYGSEEKAERRIVPFSFFPFHLMAFDSYPVDAIHYLKSSTPKATTSTAEVHEEPRKKAEPRLDAPAEGPEESAAVIDVLLALRKKWAAALSKPGEQPAANETEEVPEQEIKELPVDMLEKTMIFSPAEMETAAPKADTPAEKHAPPTPPRGAPQAPPGEVVLEKTMIFSPGTIPVPPATTEPPGEAPSPRPQPGQAGAGEVLEKTMISIPDAEKHEVPEQKKKARETEAIPETVIMSLDDLKGRK